jgi:hypothetical protein
LFSFTEDVERAGGKDTGARAADERDKDALTTQAVVDWPMLMDMRQWQGRADTPIVVVVEVSNFAKSTDPPVARASRDSGKTPNTAKMYYRITSACIYTQMRWPLLQGSGRGWQVALQGAFPVETLGRPETNL